MRRTPRRRGVAAVGVFIAAQAAWMVSAAAANLPASTVPPVPPQPGTVAAGCTPDSAVPGSWTDLTTVDTAFPYSMFVPDPSNPCTIYRADDRTHLSRSTDDGASYQPVFHDTASPADAACQPAGSLIVSCEESFNATAVAVLGDHSVLLSENGNGDAMVGSADRGRTWRLDDAGIAGDQIANTVADPWDPHAAIAVNSVDGDIPAPFVTRDSGQTWQPLPLPTPLVTYSPAQSFIPLLNATSVNLLQFDPTDSSRLWAVWPQEAVWSSGDQKWGVYTTSNPSAGWSSAGTLPDVASLPFQLAVVHSPSHPRRLVVALANEGTAPYLELSDDDGATWSTRPLPAEPKASVVSTVLAEDPVDRNRLLAYDSGLAQPVFVATGDGFDSIAPVPLPGWWQAGQPGGGPYSYMLPIVADRFGSFYMWTHQSCSTPVSSPQCPHASNSITWSSLLRVTPQTSTALSTLPVAPAVAPVPTAMPLLTTCTVPAYTDPSGEGIQNGSVTFDGHDLLYTNHDEQTSPYHAVIHVLDPTQPGCPPQPDITVTFSPHDLAVWSTYNNLPRPGRMPWIDDLAYDTSRNLLWFNIGDEDDTCPPNVSAPAAHCYNGSGQNGGLFTARIGPGRIGAAHLTVLDGCGVPLTYDVVRDQLWTCHWTSNDFTGDQLSASTGAVAGGCARSIWQQESDGLGLAWAAVSPTRLDVWSENDVEVNEYDTTTCFPVRTLAHRPVSEPLNEDEQMACDPLTFGAGSASPSATVALWLRDAQASLISAYGIDDGNCPLATTTTVPATRVQQGALTTVCATVAQPYLTGVTPVAAGVPVRLSLHGAATSQTLAAMTNRFGVACAAWHALVPAGTITVTASTRPTGIDADAYLPSQGSGTVVVVGSPPPAPQQQPGSQPLAPVLPPTSGGQPPEVGGTQDVVQSQFVQQVQAQTNAQTSVQPGMIVQPQRQRQVAMQQVLTAPSLDVQLASRPRSPAASLVPLLAGALLLGIGTAARTVAPAVAAVRRRR